MKAALLTALCALGMLHAAAAPRQAPSVLFIGNSYTYVNDLPAAFDAACRAAKTKMRVDSFTEGSCALVDFYELPQFAEGKKKLAAGGYTFVVLQDQSLVPTLRPDWTLTYTRKWKELANAAHTTPVYFMTWARCTPGTLNPDMNAQDKTTAVYCRAALRDAVALVPCGEVWREWHRLYPDTTLYERDGSHPNQLGVYLNACTFYKALCKKSPVGLPARLTAKGQSLANLTPQQARECQELAERVVDSFNPRQFLDTHPGLEASPLPPTGPIGKW